MLKTIVKNGEQSQRVAMERGVRLSACYSPIDEEADSFSNRFLKLTAEDSMDDGTQIKLTVTINKQDYTAKFDFAGSGLEVISNCNAPRAVTLSAIIYALRCMIPHEIPLNQGCLQNIRVDFPDNCILNPSPEAAVVGGNVLTSQRVVDVIFRAFGTCAASQGCMNNITFGDETSGYYETVAGGAGAGPNWHGRSAVHTHMTNTRITDPEILERRYPVILQKFVVNRNSGGRGKFTGGDGVIRELLFRKNLVLSVLTERRVFAPYGLNGKNHCPFLRSTLNLNLIACCFQKIGGESGKKGRNTLVRADGRTINLGSKATTTVYPGDLFHLETPGGGGYGKYKEL